MNTVIIEGKAYPYKIRGGAVKKYERETGTSIFKLDQDTIKDFTSISDFLLACISGLPEETLDEVDFNDQIQILGEMLSGKKQVRVSDPLSESNDKPISMELPLENGSAQPETRTSTMPNISPTPMNADEVTKLIDGTSGG